MQDMLCLSNSHWGIFKHLGGSKSSTSFHGPNAIFSCSQWSIVGVLCGIIYASMASKVHLCVLCVKLVKKMSLISFSNAPSLNIFGIPGGMCGTNPIGMFHHQKNSFLIRVRLLSTDHLFKFLGLLDLPLLFCISRWRGTIIFLRMSFLEFPDLWWNILHSLG